MATVAPAAALLAVGSLLILLSVASLASMAWLLRGLAEGRRALRRQAVVGATLVVTLGARVVLISGGAFTTGPALVLVAVDLGLGLVFWRSLRDLADVLASDPPRRPTSLAWAFPVALAVVGIGSVFPALARSPWETLNLAATIGAIALWGICMAEVNGLLRTVGRPRTASLAVLSGAFLGLPQLPAVVTRGWFGREVFLGTDLVLLEVAGVLAAGLCSAGATLSLRQAVRDADAEAVATRRVLQHAATTRAAATLVVLSRPDVLGLLHGNANLVADPGGERVCPECGRPVEGLEYHRHGLAERRARTHGVVRVRHDPEQTSAQRLK